MQYSAGDGVIQDFVVAHMWENLARAQGEENAKRVLGILEQLMTKEQIAEAQKMAREWQEKRQ